MAGGRASSGARPPVRLRGCPGWSVDDPGFLREWFLQRSPATGYSSRDLQHHDYRTGGDGGPNVQPFLDGAAMRAWIQQLEYSIHANAQGSRSISKVFTSGKVRGKAENVGQGQTGQWELFSSHECVGASRRIAGDFSGTRALVHGRRGGERPTRVWLAAVPWAISLAVHASPTSYSDRRWEEAM